MAVRTLTEAIDNLYTTTWYEMKDQVIDQIFDATPFWFLLKDKGAMRTQSGGRKLTWPLSYSKSDNIRWIKKGSTVPLDDKEHLTMAEFLWRYLADSIVRFGIDDQQNRGKYQIINLMNSKLETSRQTMIDTLETALFSTVSTDANTGALSIEGLQRLVPDDPTAAVLYGDIDPSVNTWWRNKTKNMTGLSFATNGIPELRTLINNASNNRGQDRINLLLSGQTPYEYYEDSVIEQKRIVNQKLGDAGFENIEYKGIPWVWAPACANTRLYGLNLNYLYFLYDPDMFFDMTEWKPIPEQVNDRAAQIVTAGNLITNRRRVHFVMHTIDTA